MDPHFENIWRWHSIEEVEHKSVTMDVYQTINGKPIRRQLALIFAIMLYVWSVGNTTVQLLRSDKQLWKLQTAIDAWQMLFAPKGVIRETWIKVLHFFRKDFHPTDHDDTQLMNFRKT
jgi:predicted metal-dependent hydrolase